MKQDKLIATVNKKLNYFLLKIVDRLPRKDGATHCKFHLNCTVERKTYKFYYVCLTSTFRLFVNKIFLKIFYITFLRNIKN